jgi:hypothetical protein
MVIDTTTGLAYKPNREIVHNLEVEDAMCDYAMWCQLRDLIEKDYESADARKLESNRQMAAAAAERQWAVGKDDLPF